MGKVRVPQMGSQSTHAAGTTCKPTDHCELSLEVLVLFSFFCPVFLPYDASKGINIVQKAEAAIWVAVTVLFLTARTDHRLESFRCGV